MDDDHRDSAVGRAGASPLSAALLTLKDAKPCPFCGGKKFETFDLDNYLIVRCKSCDAEGPQNRNADQMTHSAVERWNKRV